MKNIIVIAGPTGVGKTKLSVQLAKLIDAEIINADSMQVYKNLNIGTAKIKDDEKENIVHHLFDIVDINDIYTIFDYQKDCRKEIEKILKKGKKVILVGGSGLYIRSALYDYKFEKENIKNSYDDKTNAELLEIVKKIEPNTTIHINNRKRLIRFLQKKDNNQEIRNFAEPIYDFDIIGLTTDREKLYDIIDNRVDKMIDDGLIEEVKRLYDKLDSEYSKQEFLIIQSDMSKISEIDKLTNSVFSLDAVIFAEGGEGTEDLPVYNGSLGNVHCRISRTFPSGKLDWGSDSSLGARPDERSGNRGLRRGRGRGKETAGFHSGGCIHRGRRTEAFFDCLRKQL